MSIVYRLPLPVSVNNLYRNRDAPRPNGHPIAIPGRLKTKAHKAWWKEAAQMVAIQRLEGRQPNLTGKYVIRVTLQRCRADLSNLLKCVEDLLVDMGVVVDDSLCERIEMEWGDVKGAEVTIEAV